MTIEKLQHIHTHTKFPVCFNNNDFNCVCVYLVTEAFPSFLPIVMTISSAYLLCIAASFFLFQY